MSIHSIPPRTRIVAVARKTSETLLAWTGLMISCLMVAYLCTLS